MAAFKYLREVYQRTENELIRFFLRNGPFPHGYLEPALSTMPIDLSHETTDSSPMDDKKSEGFLWGVPKKRISIQRRWCKQMGARNWYWKMLIPKYNIRICETCGHHYEAKHLCRNCYERVKMETEEIRKKTEAQIGANPEDKEVIVLYENENSLDLAKSEQGKLLVEVPKPRPAWFSSNLLQKTTAEPDHATTTVATTKPNLG